MDLVVYGIGDLHLTSSRWGSPSRGKFVCENFEKLCTKIASRDKDKQTKIVVIPGDIFDKKTESIEVVMNFIKGVNILTNSGWTVFVSSGNHDSGKINDSKVHDSSFYMACTVLKEYNPEKFFFVGTGGNDIEYQFSPKTIKTDDVTVSMVPWLYDNEAWKEVAMNSDVSSGTNILIGHYGVRDRMGHGFDGQEIVELMMKYDIVLLNHQHAPYSIANIHSIGVVNSTSISESDDERGGLVRYDGKSLQRLDPVEDNVFYLVLGSESSKTQTKVLKFLSEISNTISKNNMYWFHTKFVDFSDEGEQHYQSMIEDFFQGYSVEFFSRNEKSVKQSQVSGMKVFSHEDLSEIEKKVCEETGVQYSHVDYLLRHTGATGKSHIIEEFTKWLS